MTWRRGAARAISECTALVRNLAGARAGLRILLYHAVGTSLSTDSYGISISPDLFERHMVALAEIPEIAIVNLRAPEPSDSGLEVAVTFDDGYKDNLYAAAPVLLKHRIPFTVFVTSSFVQRGQPEYLTESELKDLAALPGAAVGSHGVTHARLAECDERTLWRELVESRQYLEGVIGRPITAMSYPHGSANLRVRDAVKRAGYSLGVCSRFDINRGDRDPLLLCRTEIVSADSERVFLQKLRGAWDWCRWRSRDSASIMN